MNRQRLKLWLIFSVVTAILVIIGVRAILPTISARQNNSVVNQYESNANEKTKGNNYTSNGLSFNFNNQLVEKKLATNGHTLEIYLVVSFENIDETGKDVTLLTNEFSFDYENQDLIFYANGSVFSEEDKLTTTQVGSVVVKQNEIKKLSIKLTYIIEEPEVYMENPNQSSALRISYKGIQVGEVEV